MARKHSEAGSALIEFTFVGIPLIFVIISTFEIARGMWIYETLAYASREGARFASLHGNNCAKASLACPVQVTAIVDYIRQAGVGLLPEDLTITMSSFTRPNVVCKNGTCSSGGCFPAAAACDASLDTGGIAGQPVEVTLDYTFRSGVAMFWPGGTPIVFGAVNLRASSQEAIHF